jgi:hypothetical protein
VDEFLRGDALAARAEIRSGTLRGAVFRDRILGVPFQDRDVWVDVALGIDDPAPEDDPNLPRGAVFYLPCGVADLLAFVAEAHVTANDHVVDIGSGLGRAAVLVHLLTGARISGVELQAPLVARARHLAETLGVTSASFLHADAGAVELDGSVFFLYAPCNGDMLFRVLSRVESVARRRRIVVATVGLSLPELPWLAVRGESHGALTLHDSQ